MNSLLNYGHEKNCLMDTFFVSIIKRLFDDESSKANNKIGTTANEKSERVVKSDGGYKCIHLPAECFIRQLQFVIKKLELTPAQIAKMKFVDVGCGVGQKVFLAHCFGFECFGLELRAELIDAGQHLFDNMYVQKPAVRSNEMEWRWRSPSFFIQGNALTYDGYNQFDIIYFFCPLFKDELEIELEKKIAADAKPGTILMANLPKYFYKKAPEGWKPLGNIKDDNMFHDGLIFQKI